MILIFYFNELKHFNDLKPFNFLKYLHYFKEGAVQRTVNTTGLTAILRKACLYGWPLPGIWELVFPPFSDGQEWLTVPQLSVETMCFAEHPLSLWESGILVCAKQKLPRGPASNEKPWH